MKHHVGISDMKVSNTPGEEIITHSLGSCIGVAIYDPVSCVGGMLHFQLPSSKDCPERAKSNPLMFADTGVPALFRAAYEMGAKKNRLQVKVAGGSNLNDRNDFFQIGYRNYISLKKLLQDKGISVDAEDVGGNSWRNMRIDIGTGMVWIKKCDGEFSL